MHLWPSLRIRESFKLAYLEKLEWNLHRMKREKNQPRQSQSPTTNSQQRLLDNDTDENRAGGGALALCRDVLMILSCCYCCFCCGVCVDDEEY